MATHEELKAAAVAALADVAEAVGFALYRIRTYTRDMPYPDIVPNEVERAAKAATIAMERLNTYLTVKPLVEAPAEDVPQ